MLSCDVWTDHVWQRGDCFAFISEDDGPAMPGNVLYGEVLEVLADDLYSVRVYCEREEVSAVETYERFCMNVLLTRAQMDRAAREGWPPAVAWLRALVAN